jgi:hypothetical protein
MRRMIPIVLGVAALAAVASAQDDKVLMAAPGNLKMGAGIVKFKADGTYDTVKPSTNGLVCYDKSGFPSVPAVFVECTAQDNLARETQNIKIEALGDKAKVQAAFDAAEKDGSRVKPKFGSVWYHYMGPDAEHARNHMTIAVPGATAASMGLPDNNKSGGVWIMNAGTSTAHLMTPGE